MHVIIDGTTTQDEFSYAGIGQYAKNIILVLAKYYPKTDFSVLLFDNKESTLDDEIGKYSNIKIESIGKYRKSNYMNDIWYFLQVLPVIKRIRKPDSVYYCPFFWRNFPSYSMPTVLFVHDMNMVTFNMYSQISPVHNAIRGVQYWMTMYKSLKCKYLVCNSETTKRDYLKYFKKYSESNMPVSYMGVEFDEKESTLKDLLPGDYKKKKYLLYYGGGINKSKNSIGVILGYAEFVKLLEKEKKAVPYLVIAGGKFSNKKKREVVELYKAVKNNGLDGKVIFSGFYPDEAKYSLIKNSFAFIHLALSEGFGIAPIEAMKAKVPSILHKSPVYRELFNDVAVMVDGEDYIEVGSAIYDVYKNPEKYKKLVDKGFMLTKKYNYKDTAKITHDTLGKAVEGIN